MTSDRVSRPRRCPPLRIALPRGPRVAPLVVAGAIALVAVPGLRAQPAGSPATTVTVDVPAGTLAAALNRYALQAGVSLVIDDQRVQGLRSPGVAGTVTVEEGFRRLLAGTGHRVERSGAGFVLVPDAGTAPGAAVAAPAVAATATLPTVAVTAPRFADSREFVDDGWLATGATAGSRVELSIKDVPQSVTVINADLLRDLAPARISQVADYVAGVESYASAATPYTNAFFFRGFGSTGSSTFNGYRDSGFLSAQSPVNIERIEFLKGPASVLYGGAAGLSGLVNYVSKRPLAQPMREVRLGLGSFGYRTAQFDLTGPVTDDRRLRFRVTGSFDQGGNHRDHYDQRSAFVSPYLSWDLTPATRLDLELLGQDSRFDGRENFLPRHPVSFELPVRTNLGPGGRGADHRRLARVDLRHRFDNGWQLRQGLYLSNVDKTDDYSFQFLAVNADGRTGTRRVRSLPERERDRASQTELSGVVRTGPLTHELLAGIEFASRRFAYEFYVAPATGVDLFDPQPGVQTGPLGLSGDPWQAGADTRGIYLQDLIDLGTGLKLMLGVRHDRVDHYSRAQGAAPGASTDKSEGAWSPRVGLIYQPAPSTAWYTSYGRSFSPQLGRSRTGEVFDPQQGSQVELGVRHDLWPGLSLSGAVFDYRRSNVLTSDPDAPAGSGFSIAVGEQRSRGLELELTGRVTADYSVVASYGYLDAKVTRDNRLPVGDRMPGVPRHSLALFNRLRLAVLGAPAWSATLGVVHAGARESGLPNSSGAFTAEQLRIPAFTRLDAGLIYETGRYTWRLSGTNLTNEKLYDSQGSVLLTRAPRAFLASLSVRF